MVYKLIQVGLGAHGMGITENVIVPSTDFSLVGLVDIDSERVKQCAEEFGVPTEGCFTDYEKAFETLEADAVFIAVISPLHYAICKSALDHGLHVMIEKPFTVTMEEAKELTALAKLNNLKITVNQNYRYFPTVLTAKDAIDSHSLGRPLFANVQFYFYHDGKPYQRQMENYMLMEMAVHHIDMIRYLFSRNIVSVLGKTWNVPDSGYVGDPNVQAVYELENGISVFYIGSLLSKGQATPWESSWRIQCENGSIHIDDLGQGHGVYVVDDRGSLSKLDLLQPEKESVDAVLAEFAAAIRENRESYLSAEDNLQTMAALIATSISSKDHRSVQLASLLE
ncbi:Gfo/Idh/MocA family protein [Paenibacillus sp. FA6]|uniref:Gfo/Idh/MocA family protein n=1 Tax=Paenibacillus sp. FA6 TaxID=3413029 RepID=UPI003F65973D